MVVLSEALPQHPFSTSAIVDAVSVLCLCGLCTCFNSPMAFTEPSSISTPQFSSYSERIFTKWQKRKERRQCWGGVRAWHDRRGDGPFPLKCKHECAERFFRDALIKEP